MKIDWYCLGPTIKVNREQIYFQQFHSTVGRVSIKNISILLKNIIVLTFLLVRFCLALTLILVAFSVFNESRGQPVLEIQDNKQSLIEQLYNQAGEDFPAALEKRSMQSLKRLSNIRDVPEAKGRILEMTAEELNFFIEQNRRFGRGPFILNGLVVVH